MTIVDSTTEDDLPRSNPVAQILKRHNISPASYSRSPIKLEVFYVGRSPRATVEAERDWLRRLHAAAAQQQAINTERARATQALRKCVQQVAA